MAFDVSLYDVFSDYLSVGHLGRLKTRTECDLNLAMKHERLVARVGAVRTAYGTLC